MSLEECKRLEDERRERLQDRRRSIGKVDGEEVEIVFARNPLGSSPRKCWVVFVSAYNQISTKYFKKKEKDSAERYFEDLTQKYGLKEKEK